MSIMCYVTANGAAHGYIADNITIAQAQANGQLADDATLTANGLWRTIITPLSETNVWDPTTLTTKTVPAPTPANICASFDFIMAFTPAELAAIRGASGDNNIQQFLYAMEVTQGMNLNHTTIVNALTYLVNHGFLTQARANTIQATVSSGAANSTG
jgi:hypothetical protein